MLKRITSIILSLALILCLAACGGKESGGKKGDVSASKSEGWKEILKSMPEELRGTTITVYSWNDVSDVTDAQKVIDSFTAETGIKVEWVKGTYDNYYSEIAAMVAAKEAPDIVRLRELNVGLMSVLQPFENTGFDLKDPAWDDDVKDFYTINGKTYGMNMENTLIQQPKILWYNRNLISKYELEDPYELWKRGEWTYEKFVQVCEDFMDEAPSDELAWTTHKFSDVCDMMGAGTILYKDGRFVSNTSDPNLVKGWQMLVNLREDGIVGNAIYERDRFGSGKILFFSDSTISGRRTHFYWPDLKSTGALGCVAMPSMEGFDYIQEFTEYEAYGIPQTAKNAKAVPYFLYYYLNGDNYDKDTFFCDSTILDVYEWCMKQENNFINCDASVLTDDVGLKADIFKATMKGQKENQVISKLNSFVSVIEAAVEQTNSRLDKIGK